MTKARQEVGTVRHRRNMRRHSRRATRSVPDERQKVIDEMARYTGLSKEVIDQANLRIDVPKFTHYFLIDQKLRVGRLDGRLPGRIRGIVGYALLRSHRVWNSAAVHFRCSMIMCAQSLGYKTDMPYYTFAPPLR